MELRFFGATGGTTGTCHMLKANGRVVLLDCGMFQGPRAWSRMKNAEFHFEAQRIDAVVQSHAHVDHSGKLPMLTRHGFKGAIHATPATRDLCDALLHDTAKILAADARFLNEERRRADEARSQRKHGDERRRGHEEERAALRRGRKHRGDKRPAGGPRRERDGLDDDFDWSEHAELDLPQEEILPLYLDADVDEALARFEQHPYHEWFEPVPGMRFRFHDAGHILGSAWVEARIEDGARTHRLVFTGDYGRKGAPILRDPEPLLPADIYISESTYGDRLHEPFSDMESQLAAAVGRLHARGRGKLIIPAFAVGRTQHLLYAFAKLVHEGRMHPIDIVVDSPLATRATRIVLDHPECFDAEALEQWRRYQQDGAFRDRVRFVESVEESKALNRDARPVVVISASGMMESGRVMHHLLWNLEKEETEVLVVGFQARGTLGRRLVDGEREVRVLGRQVEVAARITTMLGFSAHADRQGLLDALLPHAAEARQLFLVHGEAPERDSLAEACELGGFKHVLKPMDSSPFRV
jgi:metallo-beta-lactamase family protein